MISEDIVNKVAVFFHYSLLNNPLALNCSRNALKKIRRCRSNDGITDGSVLVRITYQFWQNQRKKNRLSDMGGNAWIRSQETSLGPWREFHRSVEADEFLAIIWCKIIGLSESDIADGLDVSTGTVRYRLNRGLKKLGELIGPTDG